MTDHTAKIQACIDRALGTDNIEEARTSALIALQLMKKHGFKITRANGTNGGASPPKPAPPVDPPSYAEQQAAAEKFKRDVWEAIGRDFVNFTGMPFAGVNHPSSETFRAGGVNPKYAGPAAPGAPPRSRKSALEDAIRNAAKVSAQDEAYWRPPTSESAAWADSVSNPRRAKNVHFPRTPQPPQCQLCGAFMQLDLDDCGTYANKPAHRECIEGELANAFERRIQLELRDSFGQVLDPSFPNGYFVTNRDQRVRCAHCEEVIAFDQAAYRVVAILLHVRCAYLTQRKAR